jgi:hypothetical protein
MSEGHFGAPGRFEELDELAMILAFAIEVTGMHRPGAAMTVDQSPPEPTFGRDLAPIRPPTVTTPHSAGEPLPAQ